MTDSRTTEGSAFAYKVELKDYHDLTETQQKGASNNGSGKEYANYLHVTENYRTLLLESDAMEPEDATFTRDLAWIKGALEQAYQCGLAARLAPEPAAQQDVETIRRFLANIEFWEPKDEAGSSWSAAVEACARLSITKREP